MYNPKIDDCNGDMNSWQPLKRFLLPFTFKVT